jgi:hypothetical protein
MRFIARLVTAKLLVFTTGAAAETDPRVSLPSATALLSENEASGARAVLDRLWANERQFDSLCTAIESAEPSWLEVARRLRPSSDAGITLSLNYSVARALPAAPAQVLGLIGRGFTLDDICTSPFIEPEPEVAERYEQRALNALGSLRGSPLGPVAEQCAARVRLPER